MCVCARAKAGVDTRDWTPLSILISSILTIAMVGDGSPVVDIFVAHSPGAPPNP